MEQTQFWGLIDKARESVGSTEEMSDAVGKALLGLTADEIVAFRQQQDQLMAESYRWDVWAVAYIVNGGCSDDGFDYFRAALMAEGSKRWLAAMARHRRSVPGSMSRPTRC